MIELWITLISEEGQRYINPYTGQDTIQQNIMRYVKYDTLWWQLQLDKADQGVIGQPNDKSAKFDRGLRP